MKLEYTDEEYGEGEEIFIDGYKGAIFHNERDAFIIIPFNDPDMAESFKCLCAGLKFHNEADT